MKYSDWKHFNLPAVLTTPCWQSSRAPWTVDCLLLIFTGFSFHGSQVYKDFVRDLMSNLKGGGCVPSFFYLSFSPSLMLPLPLYYSKHSTHWTLWWADLALCLARNSELCKIKSLLSAWLAVGGAQQALKPAHDKLQECMAGRRRISSSPFKDHRAVRSAHSIFYNPSHAPSLNSQQVRKLNRISDSDAGAGWEAASSEQP